MPSISSVFYIADPDLLNKIRLSLAAVCPSAWSLKELFANIVCPQQVETFWSDLQLQRCRDFMYNATDKQYIYIYIYYSSIEVSFSSGKAKIRENTKIPKTLCKT